MSSIAQIAKFVTDVRAEYLRITERHGRLTNHHQGWAETFEELDELWDQVRERRRNRDPDAMYKECVQVAARAMRFALDLCLPPSHDRD